jgi:hypothetical protein
MDFIKMVARPVDEVDESEVLEYDPNDLFNGFNAGI